MRKIMMAAATITLLMTMAVLTACTSDDDDNPADGGMVGKWCASSPTTTMFAWCASINTERICPKHPSLGSMLIPATSSGLS